MRTVLIALVLVLAMPAVADARLPLTKETARSQGYKFTAPFVDLLDVNRTVETHMVRPGLCHRVSARTVECYFWAYLVATHKLVGGNLRIHRQRDGLLGFLLPFDPWDYTVPVSTPPESGSVPDPGSAAS